MPPSARLHDGVQPHPRPHNLQDLTDRLACFTSSIHDQIPIPWLQLLLTTERSSKPHVLPLFGHIVLLLLTICIFVILFKFKTSLLSQVFKTLLTQKPTLNVSQLEKERITYRSQISSSLPPMNDPVATQNHIVTLSVL